MMERLARLLEYPQYLILEHFLRFWLVSLAAIVVIGWLSRRVGTAASAATRTNNDERGANFPPASGWFDGAMGIFLGLSIACFLFFLFYKADFACFDCDQLMDYSVAGRRFPTPIWPTNGRFFPLGMQEFNLLRYVTRTAAGYQSFAAAQLLILAGVLLAVLKDCRVAWRAIIVAAVMATPSVAIAFTGLIYPERDALFWLVILVFCLQRANDSNTPAYFLGCFVATHFLLYYKEPLVILIVTYAGSRVLLDLQTQVQTKNRGWRESLRRNIVPFGMLGVAGIFLVLFLVFMFPFRRPEFIKYQVVDRQATLMAFLQTDWWICLFLVILAVRLTRWLFFGGRIESLWESLALGAVGYLAAILWLGIYHDYYLAPVDLIAALYVGRLAAQWTVKGSRMRAALVWTTCVCLLLHGAAYSALQVFDRTVQMIQEGELAKFLTAHKADSGQREIELFFPLTGGYQLAQISSYLRYKGVPITGQINSGEDRVRVVVSGKDIYPSGKCFEDKRYACKHAEEPAAGGLLVVLPSDFAQERDLEKAQKFGVPLVSVADWPEKSWRGRVLRLVQVLSWERGGRRLPQPWWNLRVFGNPMSTATGSVKATDLHPVTERIPTATLSER